MSLPIVSICNALHLIEFYRHVSFAMLFDGRAGPAGGGQGDRGAVEGDSVRAARGEDQEAQAGLLQGQLQEETALGS